MMISVVSLLLICLQSEAAPDPPREADPPVHVSLAISPPIIPYHKQARLTITVESDPGVSVELPDITESIGALEWAGPLDAPETKILKDGRKRVSAAYNIEAIWAGHYPIGPVSVKYGHDKAVTVPGPVLTVRELTAEETEAAMQFAPNAQPMDPPFELLKRPWFWASAAAAALTGIIVVALRLRKRRQRIATGPPMPPWETAYARLRQLDEQGLPEKGDYETYYVELSSILRHYIEDRFMLHAPEQTTPEFLADAGVSGLLTMEQQRLLAGFLHHSDRVKFARYEPSLGEMEQAMADALHFVDETVPAPTPTQEAA